jgi:hypothetical protein
MADDNLGGETPKEKKKREKAEAKARKAREKQEKKYAKEAARLGISTEEYRSIMEVEMGERRSGKKPGKGHKKAKARKEGAPAAAVKGEAVAADDDDDEFEEVVPWSRKSVEPIDDIERRIDRMSGTAVKSLKDRYAEKYGESLIIPDLYQARLDEMEEGSGDSLYDQPEGRESDPLDEEPKKGGGFLGRIGGRKRKKKGDEGLLGKDEEFAGAKKDGFFARDETYDESFWHLRRWWPDNRESGKVATAFGFIFGVFVYILVLIPRLITTPIINRKRKKDELLYGID